jgi:hypothetical protein
MLFRVGVTTWFPSAGNETPMKSLSSRYSCTVATLLVWITEDLLFGAAVRLSNALTDVFCLKRGTTFSTIPSMLLMRHERNAKPLRA